MGRSATTRAQLIRRDLGAVLRQRRLELNLSQDDLACAVDVTQGTISNYENGRSAVPLSILVGMCDELQLHPKDLLDLFRAPELSAASSSPQPVDCSSPPPRRRAVS